MQLFCMYFLSESVITLLFRCASVRIQWRRSTVPCAQSQVKFKVNRARMGLWSPNVCEMRASRSHQLSLRAIRFQTPIKLQNQGNLCYFLESGCCKTCSVSWNKGRGLRKTHTATENRTKIEWNSSSHWPLFRKSSDKQHRSFFFSWVDTNTRFFGERLWKSIHIEICMPRRFSYFFTKKAEDRARTGKCGSRRSHT